MRAALVQFESGLDSVVNRDTVAARLDRLDPSVDLVVLPEAAMHDFGAPDHDLAAAAEPLDGPFVQLLGEHARRLDTTIVAGMFEQNPDAPPFNTLVALGPDGRLTTMYRKVHLYDSFGYRESDRLSPGPITPVVIDVADTTIGLMTCYDLRFPEMARLLVDAGADAFVLPAAWVAGSNKLHHWRTLLAARAIENTVHVLATAQGGPRYTGHSIVLDPMGAVLAEADDADETLTALIDPDTVTAARDVNPSLANRRIR